jgi:hypothetical protein
VELALYEITELLSCDLTLAADTCKKKSKENVESSGDIVFAPERVAGQDVGKDLFPKPLSFYHVATKRVEDRRGN